MRTIHLSDHVSDLLQASERFLAVARDDRDVHHVRWEEATASHRRARAARPLWRRALGLATPEERAARFRLAQQAGERDAAGRRVEELERRVHQQAAGARGERVLDGWLADLPDDWVLVQGYRNRKGEIDRLLIGPAGVWAFEVKNMKVWLTVDGDEWRFERVDGSGSVQGGGPATDRRGRSWGRQVVEPAAELASFLAGRGRPAPVRTAVVLVNDGARVVRCRRSAVDLVTADSGEVRTRVRSDPPTFDARTCDAIVRLVQKDHRHHLRGRAARAERRRAGAPADSSA